MKTFTAYIEWDEDTQLYVGIIPVFPALIHKAQLWMNFKKISKRFWNYAWRNSKTGERTFLTSWASTNRAGRMTHLPTVNFKKDFGFGGKIKMMRLGASYKILAVKKEKEFRCDI